MVETLSMSCMQQQQQQAVYFSSPLTTVSPAAYKGVVNLHHHHHHHNIHPSENGHHLQQHNNNAMKSLTPDHDPQLGDLGEFGSPFYGDNMVDYGSERMCRNQAGTNYDLTHIYSNGTPDCTTITAINKTSMGNNGPQEVFEGKLPSKWTHNELLLWIAHVCEENKLDYQEFRYGLNELSGRSLSEMLKPEFIATFHNGGAIVYDAFHRLNNEMSSDYMENNSSTNYHQYNPALDQSTFCKYTNFEIGLYGYENSSNNNHLSFTHVTHPSNNQHPFDSQYNMLPSPNAQTMLIEHEQNQVKVEMDSEGESDHSYTNLYPHSNNIIIPAVDSTKLQRRKPGRPPIKDKKSKNGGQRNSRLWEFIRDLLLDAKTCPSLLKWENVDEGIFRFVQSDKVARLWGERKCNPRMTYEKLSRAMRYYYKSQVFQPVIGRRLVYKFGPNATGWRPSPDLYS